MSVFFQRTPFHPKAPKKKKAPMNSKARCTVCKQFVPRDEIIFANKMAKVCSSECFGTLMGRQRAAKNRPDKTSSRRRRKRLEPVIPIAVRAQIHTRDHNLCRCCGARGTQVHHVQYRSQGGKEDISNLILLCNDCHTTKAHGDQSHLYRELFRQYIWLVLVEGRSVFVSELLQPRLQQAS